MKKMKKSFDECPYVGQEICLPVSMLTDMVQFAYEYNAKIKAKVTGIEMVAGTGNLAKGKRWRAKLQVSEEGRKRPIAITLNCTFSLRLGFDLVGFSVQLTK